MAKFKLFEKSTKDRENKKFGKEGSRREEAYDAKQSRFAAGGIVRGKGAAQRGTKFSGDK